MANSRILKVEEIKSIPYVPVSHPFVEPPIGTIRREYLDRVFFCNVIDLKRKLDEFRVYYNASRVHQSPIGSTPAELCNGSPKGAVAAIGPVTIGFGTPCASNDMNNETEHTAAPARIDDTNFLTRWL